MRSDEEKHIKRIQISQEASYLDRLETAYIGAMICLGSERGVMGDLGQQAQDALAKIREGR